MWSCTFRMLRNYISACQQGVSLLARTRIPVTRPFMWNSFPRDFQTLRTIKPVRSSEQIKFKIFHPATPGKALKDGWSGIDSRAESKDIFNRQKHDHKAFLRKYSSSSAKSGVVNQNLISRPHLLRPSHFLSNQLNDSLLYQCETFHEAWRLLSKSPRANHSHPCPSSHALEDLASLADATQKAEIYAFLALLPDSLRNELCTELNTRKLIKEGKGKSLSFQESIYPNIVELYLHVGQKPRIYFSSGMWIDLSTEILHVDIKRFVENLQFIRFGERKKNSLYKLIRSQDMRAGVPGTLHRVGFYLDKSQSHILGCTIRFGRYIPFTGTLISDLLGYGSVIVIAPPCCGKTTILRDSIANLCSSKSSPKVVVVDTSNEIIGDTDEPAPYFGSVRRLQVPCRKSQSEFLVQAVQNHSPDIVVVDEIGNTEECEGICSIIHRGTKVLCSVHGWSLASVVRNLKLNTLFGGSQPLLLSYEEKRAKQKLRKTALERMNPIGFHFAVQLQKGTYGKALLYLNLDKTVDKIYDSENWISGGSDMAFEVDIGKPLNNQPSAAEILKGIGK